MKFKQIYSSPYIYLSLFSLYPLLHLYAKNFGQVEFVVVLSLMAAIEVLALTIFFLTKIFLRDDAKAAILTTILMLMFLSYGHLYQLMQGWQVGIFNSLSNSWVISIHPGRHRYIALFFFLVFVLVGWFVYRRKASLNNFNVTLNATGVFLMLFPIVTIITGSVTLAKGINENGSMRISSLNHNIKSKPDVYYIIPDEHPRQDILKTYFNYDDSGFINGLKDKGFCVADKSYANYAQTLLSVPSSLNMQYWDKFGKAYRNQPEFFTPLFPLLQNSLVQKTFKSYGYETVAFSSGFVHTDALQSSVDLFLAPKQGYLGDFVNEFLNTTPMGFVIKNIPSFSPYRIHRDKVLYEFAKLPSVAKIKAPTFTIAHIVAPHPPFVFDKNGSEIVQNEPFDLAANSFAYNLKKDYAKRYSQQIRYTDKKLLEAVDKIIKNSSKPPIIIIQSDHGPGGEFIAGTTIDDQLKIRMANLNAYYLPGVNCSQIKPDMTPVNSFRFILDHYFGAHYQILQNHAYFSHPTFPFKFEDVTQIITSQK